MITKGRLFLTLPLFLVLAFGCKKGNPNAPATVSGKVTYGGNNVTAGSVQFHTKEGAILNCPIKSDGTYSGVDMPTGEMAVTVETESANKNKTAGRAYDKGRGGQMGMPYTPKDVTPAGGGEYVKIPPKYADVKTSPLKTTLNKGSNTYNIELTD